MKDFTGGRMKLGRWSRDLAKVSSALILGTLLSGNHLALTRTALQDPKQPAPVATAQDPAPVCAEADQLRKKVQQLTVEGQGLKKKVADLQKELQIYSVQDLLTKEEQRGENLQLRLIDIAEKEAGLQTRLDQVNQQLRPENLERALAGVGSLHPEDSREEARKRLSNERQRIQVQVDLLRQDRIRTQASLATADASILRLRMKLSEVTKP